MAEQLEIGTGDTVEIEGYAYFEGSTGYSNPGNLPAFVAAVAGAFGGIDGSGVPAEQATFDMFDNAYGIIGLQGTDADIIPAAYLNYILFDQNMTYIRSGFKQVSSSANFDKEYVTFPGEIVIEEPGFIYCFVSMESATGRVFWDDVKVTLHEHPVVKTNDYYPGGLTFNSFNRVTAKKNKFLYQNKEWKTDLDVNLYDFEWRQYDPAIWRTPIHDPNAEDYNQLSPYSWAANNPISNVDPDGRDWYRYSDDDGNESVIWREGNDQTIDIDGQTYNNIGAAFATQAADGSLVIYNQNEVFAIVDAEAPAGNAQEQALLSQLQNPEAEVNYNTMTPLYGTMFFAAETALMISGEAGLSGQTSRTPRNGLKRTNQSPRGQNAVLNEAQKANLKRFLKKAPANSKPPQLRVLGNGNVQISIESPGKVPGSRAIYVKEIDSTGTTVKMYKVTRDPQFNLVHNKNKMPGN